MHCYILALDMVGCSPVFVVDAEKALKRAAKGFCRESRALDTVFRESRNMGFGFWISNYIQPNLLEGTQFDWTTFLLKKETIKSLSLTLNYFKNPFFFSFLMSEKSLV